MEIGCIVLAGGKGLRLGRDKALETVDSQSLLQRVVTQLSSFSSEIIIVTAKGKSFPQFFRNPRFRIVADAYPGRGALVGLATGLAASRARYNLAVACDMPFLNQALLRYMLGLMAGFDLVVPRLAEMVEPLHAVYARSCLAPMERLLEQGDMRINALLGLVKVRYVEADEVDRFDPRHLSFFNVNTRADLERAQRLAKEISNR
ncbi:MAG: molybdenum cofactor guanylyltransferase [Dehalococcoidales bacterium]|nr:molybdenum cofactor guanylyltransferase [Dehalococcoidales bacterium]